MKQPAKKAAVKKAAVKKPAPTKARAMQSKAKPAARPAPKAAKSVPKVVSRTPAKAIAKPAPAALRPAASKPAVPKPAAPKLAAAKPAALKPVLGKPALSKPAAPTLAVRKAGPGKVETRKASAPAVPAKMRAIKMPVRPAVPVPAVDVAAFRERLVQKRDDIISMVKRDQRAGQEASDDTTDDIVDRANNAYHRELMFALSDGERGILLQVEDALKRADAGTYGACVHCGAPIAHARLQALPWARYCIDCQELQEKGMLED